MRLTVDLTDSEQSAVQALADERGVTVEAILAELRAVVHSVLGALLGALDMAGDDPAAPASSSTQLPDAPR